MVPVTASVPDLAEDVDEAPNPGGRRLPDDLCLAHLFAEDRRSRAKREYSVEMGLALVHETDTQTLSNDFRTQIACEAKAWPTLFLNGESHA